MAKQVFYIQPDMAFCVRTAGERNVVERGSKICMVRTPHGEVVITWDSNGRVVAAMSDTCLTEAAVLKEGAI